MNTNLTQLLSDLHEYFDDRADVSNDGTQSNQAMRFVQEIEKVQAEINRQPATKPVFDLRIHRTGKSNAFIYSQLEEMGAGYINLELVHLPSVITFYALLNKIDLDIRFMPSMLEVYEDGELTITITEKILINSAETDLRINEEVIKIRL